MLASGLGQSHAHRCGARRRRSRRAALPVHHGPPLQWGHLPRREARSCEIQRDQFVMVRLCGVGESTEAGATEDVDNLSRLRTAEAKPESRDTGSRRRCACGFPTDAGAAHHPDRRGGRHGGPGYGEGEPRRQTSSPPGGAARAATWTRCPPRISFAGGPTSTTSMPASSASGPTVPPPRARSRSPADRGAGRLTGSIGNSHPRSHEFSFTREGTPLGRRLFIRCGGWGVQGSTAVCSSGAVDESGGGGKGGLDRGLFISRGGRVGDPTRCESVHQFAGGQPQEHGEGGLDRSLFIRCGGRVGDPLPRWSRRFFASVFATGCTRTAFSDQFDAAPRCREGPPAHGGRHPRAALARHLGRRRVAPDPPRDHRPTLGQQAGRQVRRPRLQEPPVVGEAPAARELCNHFPGSRPE